MPLFGPPNVAQLAAGTDIDGLIKALRPKARSSYRGVPEAAAEALAQIGGPAVEPLIAALEEPNEDLRNAAVDALGQIGAPAVERLIAAFHVYHPNEAVRRAPGYALGRIGAPAVEPLLAVLREGGWSARAYAARALVDIYNSWQLNNALKVKILAQREAMAKSHDDASWVASDCAHGTQHRDEGIGVAFPVWQ